MLLYIVRHGETDWNKAGKVQGRTDIPLNERGRYLAEATALLNRIKGNMQIKDFWKYKVPKNCAVSVVEIKGKDIIIKEEGLIYY